MTSYTISLTLQTKEEILHWKEIYLSLSTCRLLGNGSKDCASLKYVNFFSQTVSIKWTMCIYLLVSEW